LAILAAAVFFLTDAFSLRISPAVQARRFLAFLAIRFLYFQSRPKLKPSGEVEMMSIRKANMLQALHRKTKEMVKVEL
jgi:hypothetical protein